MATNLLDRARTVFPPLARPLASIVVPAYNEGPELAAHLEALLQFLERLESRYEFEVLVIDDGSSDDTYVVAQRVAAEHDNLRVLRHIKNHGLGSAIRTGFAFARGSSIVTYDSDMSYAPEIIPQLLEEMERSNADLVLASPYMRGGAVANVPWLRKVLSREANRYLSFATSGRFATVTCMVRAYRAAFFQNLRTSEERMEINPELLFMAIKSGAVVTEIPARLEWGEGRAQARAGINLARTAKQIWRTLAYGIAHRPMLVLAIPGLFPGLLPLTVAIAVLMHANVKTLAMVTLITIIIQYSSLALFAGQLAAFATNAFSRRRHAARQLPK